MRVKVVRTPGELRDEIGHRVMVRKDWEGTVTRELDADEISAVGFHPKRIEKVYMVLFDKWEQPIAVPSVHVVEIADTADEDAEAATADA